MVLKVGRSLRYIIDWHRKTTLVLSGTFFLPNRHQHRPWKIVVRRLIVAQHPDTVRQRGVGGPSQFRILATTASSAPLRFWKEPITIADCPQDLCWPVLERTNWNRSQNRSFKLRTDEGALFCNPYHKSLHPRKKDAHIMGCSPKNSSTSLSRRTHENQGYRSSYEDGSRFFSEVGHFDRLSSCRS